MGDIHQTLDPFRAQARAILGTDRGAIAEMLATAQRRAVGHPKLQESLVPICGLVRDYASGEFDKADDDDAAWALSAVLYVISPWDLAPDYLPGGLRDDDRIVRSVTDKIDHVLREHADWLHMRRSYRASRRPV